jgi:hypothetical protein
LPRKPAVQIFIPDKNYQLDFFTPGINPLEAISRNTMRLMPN